MPYLLMPVHTGLGSLCITQEGLQCLASDQQRLMRLLHEAPGCKIYLMVCWGCRWCGGVATHAARGGAS